MNDKLPDPYGEIAAELHRIADDLAKLGPGHPAPRWFELNIQPHKADADDETIAHVDDMAVALFGVTATTEPTGGAYHHRVQRYRGPVSVTVYQQVSSPGQREVDAELRLLRAENAALRKAAVLDETARASEDGDGTPVPDGVWGESEGAGPGRHTGEA